YDADGDPDPEAAIIKTLETLARDYNKWIASIDAAAATLDQRLTQAATSNLDNCRKCHSRMLRGVETLRSNPQAMLAFRLMNKAMLVQQVRSQQLRFREL